METICKVTVMELGWARCGGGVAADMGLVSLAGGGECLIMAIAGDKRKHANDVIFDDGTISNCCIF